MNIYKNWKIIRHFIYNWIKNSELNCWHLIGACLTSVHCRATCKNSICSTVAVFKKRGTEVGMRVGAWKNGRWSRRTDTMESFDGWSNSIELEKNCCSCETFGVSANFWRHCGMTSEQQLSIKSPLSETTSFNCPLVQLHSNKLAEIIFSEYQWFSLVMIDV